MALAPGLYLEIVVGTSTGRYKKVVFMSPDLKIKTALGSHYAGWALQHQFPMKLALFFSLPINSVLIMAQLCVNI